MLPPNPLATSILHPPPPLPSWGKCEQQTVQECKPYNCSLPIRYGDPTNDGGEYKHWNHEILPHWNAKEREKWEYGEWL